MSITNREEANRYYTMLNGLVDEYLDKWKIKPSNLKKYLKPGGERFNKFLERNKLSDIPRIEVVLSDIIEDRANMEKDGIITFESFKMFESEEYKISTLKQCLYKGIEKATTNMEKIIADHFDVNLGDIDIVDADKHIFKLNDWNNDDWNIIIYSIEEVRVILDNMIDHLYGELSKKKIDMTKLISIDLSDLIDYDEFENKMNKMLGNKEKMAEIISDCLGDYKFKDEVGDYYIWIS